MAETDRRTMDDVLASIRRIVRTDKEGAVASAPADGPDDEERHARRNAGEPLLLLTPAMRVDGSAAARTAAERAGARADASAVPGPAAPDREALRAMVRSLLREELSGGAAEQAVRGIIRDELTGGRIGDNISQNVLRLIRAEVARALHEPR